MALLWSGDSRGKRLQVRSAGGTRRLYVDGVLHTQYNPALPLTGSVWDHLALSGLFAPAGAIRRVLVLGLGGGSVVHLLRRYVKPREIVAVELDPLRIQLAREHFGVRQTDARLIEADAVRWIEDYAGPPFGLVIDDLFDEWDGEACRAIPFDRDWSSRLLRVLAHPGWLTVNLAPAAALADCPLVDRVQHRRRFPAAFCFRDSRLDNAVVTFCGEHTSSQSLRRTLARHPELSGGRARALMRFRVETLWR